MDNLNDYIHALGGLISDPVTLIAMVVAVFLGIVFGAVPGLTVTLGVGLLSTLTYGFDFEIALIALIGMYVAAVYGGAIPSILLNIPGTPNSAAGALDGYPMALRGEASKALGLVTTASAVGTIMGMLGLIFLAPLILAVAFRFTSFEFALLAFMGIMLSGSLQASGAPVKGWIAGLLGLLLATIGRDGLTSYPRYTFELPALDAGLEVIPVLIGAFAIPQIITGFGQCIHGTPVTSVARVTPQFRTVWQNFRHVVRSSFIGTGIGAVPGAGEDVAAWVSYGTARASSRTPERFGKGEPAGLLSAETANNAAVGGALIPTITLGIPGSPPAAMVLAALLLHGLTPGPMISLDRPGFLMEVAATVTLAAVVMWLCGLLLAGQIIKIVKVPPAIYLPIILTITVIGTYSMGLSVENLVVMLVIGLICFVMRNFDYPMSSMVLGFILGGMADDNLRRALIVSEGSLTPFFTRPLCAIMLSVIVLMILTKTPWWRNFLQRVRKDRKAAAAH